MRTRLPNRRFAMTPDIEHTLANEGKVPFTVTYGFNDDGVIKDFFTTTPKSGTDFEHLAMDASVLVSLLLQAGYTLEEIHRRLGRPLSIIGSFVRAGAKLEKELAEERSQ